MKKVAPPVFYRACDDLTCLLSTSWFNFLFAKYTEHEVNIYSDYIKLTFLLNTYSLNDSKPLPRWGAVYSGSL